MTTDLEQMQHRIAALLSYVDPQHLPHAVRPEYFALNPEAAAEESPFGLPTGVEPEDDTTPRQQDIEQWVRDHAYAPDDIVLGDGKNYDLITADVQKLLDIAHPTWRDVFRGTGDGEGTGRG